MTILLSLSAVLAAAFYGLAWRHALRVSGRNAAPDAPDVRPAGEPGRGVLVAGAALHALAFGASVLSGPGFRYGFGPALSSTFLVGVIVLLVERASSRVGALRLIVLPATAVAALLPIFFPGSDFAAERSQPLFLPHLVCGTLAYGVLMLAALYAILLGFAERALHRRGVAGSVSRSARWIEQLPPLLVLERILFRLITFGFLMLTLTTVSGVLFSEHVFGRPLTFDHKTVFTLVSWGLFAVLLGGRHLRGWRGRTALRLTTIGFGLLLLGYVGSRFVIEVILRRG